MEVELLQDAVDQVGLSAMLVYVVERVACGLHRQCWDFEDFAIGRDDRDAGGDAKTNVAESGQFIHSHIDFLCTRHLGIEDRFSIVEDYEHLLRGQVSSQGCQVLGVLDSCTDDLGELTEKVGVGCGELITADEPTVVTKPLFDPVVMEGGQDDGCFPDSAGAD